MAGYLEEKSKYRFSSFYLFSEQGAEEALLKQGSPEGSTAEGSCIEPKRMEDFNQEEEVASSQ